MSKSRAWCYTLNNFTVEEYKCMKLLKCNYHVIGKEIGELETPHLQGYIEFENPRALTALKKINARIHWESRKGSPKEASDYCKKEGSFWESGSITNQGKRNDIEKTREILKAGGGMRTVVEEVNSYQAARMGELYLKYKETKRNWVPEVIWLWGPTGCGKSRKAFELCKEPWVSAGTLQWWDGYDAHEDVIFDEFRGDFCTYHNLLRYLDRYECKVPIKGGFRELLAKRIIITSCYPPDKVYSTIEDKNQLLRRISRIENLGTEVLEQKSGGNTETPDMVDNIEFTEEDLAYFNEL